MPPDEKRKLEKTIAALQRRWGRRVIRRGHSSRSISAVSTGFPDLDAALGVGGLPRGRMTEIGGVPTSGMATLALKVISEAQAQEGTAVYLDVERVFDPDYAARCGVNLEQLVVVRPYTVAQGVQMLPDFIADGGPDVLVFDVSLSRLTEPKTAELVAATGSRLIAPLHQSPCILVFLLSLSGRRQSWPLAHMAAVRLHIHKERWLYRRRDIRGYKAQVHVERNKLGQAGRRVGIAITFNGTVSGEGISGGSFSRGSRSGESDP